MAITRPITKTIISTTDFGIPVADQVNANTTAIAALQWGAWQNVPLLNGFTADGWTGPLKIRKTASLAHLVGAIQLASGTTQQYNICSIPVGFRPAVNTRMVVGGYYGGGGEAQTGRGDLGTDGGLNIQMGVNTYLVVINQMWALT